MPTATKEDITACFRLLLGRSPNPEEVAGHYALAGGELEDVVRSYLQSLEFQRRGLLQSGTDAKLIRLKHNLSIYVDAADQLIAPNITPDGYEPEVTDLLLKYARGCVIDIGANCGYFSLLACSLGATVYAFEPLERNVQLLMASRALNRFANLHLIAAAASDQAGTVSIGWTYTNAIVGEISTNPDSALSARYVPAVRVDACVPDDAPISLIKIDVEGHEWKALTGASRIIARCRPVILSEFAPGWLLANSHVSGRDYLERLVSWGYRIAVAGSPEVNTVTAILQKAEGVDHIDLLAVPSSL
jgi:FkbM family methyltransferase